MGGETCAHWEFRSRGGHAYAARVAEVENPKVPPCVTTLAGIGRWRVTTEPYRGATIAPNGM